MGRALLADEADGVASISIPDLDIALPVACLVDDPVVAQKLAGPGLLVSAHKGRENKRAMTGDVFVFAPLPSRGCKPLLALCTVCYWVESSQRPST